MKSLEKTPFVDVSESQQRAFLYKLFWVVRSRKFAVADIYLDIKFPVTLGFCSQVGCFCPRTLTHTHTHLGYNWWDWSFWEAALCVYVDEKGYFCSKSGHLLPYFENIFSL